MMYNFLNALFGTNSRPDIGHEQRVATVRDKSGQPALQKTVPIKGDYDSDVKALEDKYGALVPGDSITLSLTEMLEIAPRKRRRTDAYVGLISYMKAEKGITLNVMSRKAKKTVPVQQSKKKGIYYGHMV